MKMVILEKGYGERQVYIKLYPNANLRILCYFSQWLTERVHSPGQHLCKFIATKESVCIRQEFNSHRIGLEDQHGPVSLFCDTDRQIHRDVIVYIFAH